MLAPRALGLVCLAGAFLACGKTGVLNKPDAGASDGAAGPEAGTDAGFDAGPDAGDFDAGAPDVPTWRGGCFFDGPAGKLINAAPSYDLRVFGTDCGNPDGGASQPGGIVYYDNYDQISGIGDVTVLSAVAGSRPVVIAPRGGAYTSYPGNSGVVFNDKQSKLLTLGHLVGTTGDLLLADIPSGNTVTVFRQTTRILNYDFLPNDAVIFVGDYDGGQRVGTIYFWDGAVHMLQPGASRWDFQTYRLNKQKTQVSYLKNWTATLGGDLYVQDIIANAPPKKVASGATRMLYTDDGRLVFRTHDPNNGLTYLLSVRDPDGTIRDLATGVNNHVTLANTVFYGTGWNIVTGVASLFSIGVAPGAAAVPVDPKVSTYYTSVQPPESPTGVVGFVGSYDPDADSGEMWFASAPGATKVKLDDGISPAGGVVFSPKGTYGSWSRGFSNPSSPANPNPQPGISAELRVGPTAGGAAITLATKASNQYVAWDPNETAVGGLQNYDANTDTGHLVVKSLPAGTTLFEADKVTSYWFDFGVDGQSMAVIQNWNATVGRGDLILIPAGGGTPTAIDSDVPFYALPRGKRVVYMVRGGGRDGLYLGVGN
jgi:hypothetical protein